MDNTRQFDEEQNNIWGNAPSTTAGVGDRISNDYIRDSKQERTRRVTNKCETATTTIQTLRHLLGVTVRLLACPESRKIDY